MKACIVGAGSIGLRHIKNLIDADVTVAVVSRRHSPDVPNIPKFTTLAQAITEFAPDVMWICTETSRHSEDLKEIDRLAFSGHVFVEKPLFSSSWNHRFEHLQAESVHVTYPLRFHAGLQYLKQELADQRVCSANIYVGQRLTQWRPGRDHKESYSSRSDLGGGVLRDLSHEIDYSLWLFGKPRQISSLVKNFGALEISAEESAIAIYNTENGVHVSLELNYLDHLARRHLLVRTITHTYALDFIKNSLEKDGQQIDILPPRPDYYQRQVADMKNGVFSSFCTYQEGLEVLQAIEQIESANMESRAP